MPSHLKSIWRRGQRDPSTFSIHVYASTVWAHLKINEQLIFHIHGLHREKFIMDPLALSYPLTNINIHIHVQYGSNLIMSFRVKIPRMIFLFGGILVNLFLYSGVPKYQRRPRHNYGIHVHVQGKQLRISFPQCEKGTFLDIGGGGASMIRMGQSFFRLCFKTSSQNRHMCNKGK